jgi:hypothetical protein
MASQSVMSQEMVSPTVIAGVSKAPGVPLCPACREVSRAPAVEWYRRYERFARAVCGLHYWEPRETLDTHWYERMYDGGDENLLPLEPGHKYLLADRLAPGGGTLLDIGCDTENFPATPDKGYRVSRIELDRVLCKGAAGIAESIAAYEFGIRIAAPARTVRCGYVFRGAGAPGRAVGIPVRGKSACAYRRADCTERAESRAVANGAGRIGRSAESFPAMECGGTGKFLGTHGLEVLSIRKQPVGVTHTAQMIHMALRTGMSQPAAGGTSASFRDAIHNDAGAGGGGSAGKANHVSTQMQTLGRIKFVPCFPVAVVALPNVRMRAYKRTYFCCLARRVTDVFWER